MDNINLQMAKQYIADSIAVKQAFLDDPQQMTVLMTIAERCIETYRHGYKILIAGNGGSAADAQHFAGELVCRFNFDRPALSAIALTTDASVMTAIGNDYGYEDIFARQLQANGRAGDLFVAISTSGHSKNILKAIKVAKKMGISVVGLTGKSGGAMQVNCEHCLCVPSNETSLIQETHLIIEHIICSVIEKTLFA